MRHHPSSLPPPRLIRKLSNLVISTSEGQIASHYQPDKQQSMCNVARPNTIHTRSRFGLLLPFFQRPNRKKGFRRERIHPVEDARKLKKQESYAKERTNKKGKKFITEALAATDLSGSETLSRDSTSSSSKQLRKQASGSKSKDMSTSARILSKDKYLISARCHPRDRCENLRLSLRLEVICD